MPSINNARDIYNGLKGIFDNNPERWEPHKCDEIKSIKKKQNNILPSFMSPSTQVYPQKSRLMKMGRCSLSLNYFPDEEFYSIYEQILCRCEDPGQEQWGSVFWLTTSKQKSLRFPGLIL